MTDHKPICSVFKYNRQPATQPYPLSSTRPKEFRSSLKKEAIHLLARLRDWQFDAEASRDLRVGDGEGAREWEALLERWRKAKEACEEMIELVRTVEMGEVEWMCIAEGKER